MKQKKAKVIYLEKYLEKEKNIFLEWKRGTRISKCRKYLIIEHSDLYLCGAIEHIFNISCYKNILTISYTRGHYQDIEFDNNRIAKKYVKHLEKLLLAQVKIDLL